MYKHLDGFTGNVPCHGNWSVGREERGLRQPKSIIRVARSTGYADLSNVASPAEHPQHIPVWTRSFLQTPWLGGCLLASDGRAPEIRLSICLGVERRLSGPASQLPEREA